MMKKSNSTAADVAAFLSKPGERAPVLLPDKMAEDAAVVVQRQTMELDLIDAGSFRRTNFLLTNDPRAPLFTQADSVPDGIEFTIAAYTQPRGKWLFPVDDKLPVPICQDPTSSVSVVGVPARVPDTFISDIPIYGAVGHDVADTPYAMIPRSSRDDAVVGLPAYTNMFVKAIIGVAYSDTTTGDGGTINFVHVDSAGTRTLIALPLADTLAGSHVHYHVVQSNTSAGDIVAAYFENTSGVPVDLTHVVLKMVTTAVATTSSSIFGILIGRTLPSFGDFKSAGCRSRLTANTLLVSNIASMLNASGSIAVTPFRANIPALVRGVANFSQLTKLSETKTFQELTGCYVAQCPDANNKFVAIGAPAEACGNSTLFSVRASDVSISLKLEHICAVEIQTKSQSWPQYMNRYNPDVMSPIETSCANTAHLVLSRNEEHTSAIARFIEKVRQYIGPYLPRSYEEMLGRGAQTAEALFGKAKPKKPVPARPPGGGK
jgi:hypothetical protein